MGTKHVLKLSKEGRGPDTQHLVPRARGRSRTRSAAPSLVYHAARVEVVVPIHKHLAPHARGTISHTAEARCWVTPVKFAHS